MKTVSLFFLLLIGVQCVYRITGQTLGGYGADPNGISVSGISAGAAFAVQFHVAFSSEVNGVGVVAGLVYHCAEGTLAGAEMCMYDPYTIVVDRMINYADNSASEGKIDATSNIAGDKVYIFDGTKDTVVFPKNGEKTEQFYTNYGADITTEYSIDAEHCMPTVDYGNNCALLLSPYISKCDYNAAYILLNYIYGDIQEPTGSEDISGNLLEFDQNEFFSQTAASISMDTTGYIYVPTYCSTNPGCRVHIAFHGCKQGRDTIDDTYVRNAGYNEVAELNNIIIIYPQVTKSLMTPSNPNGCFDWWAYTTRDYDTKDGPQMSAVHKMLERVLSN